MSGWNPRANEIFLAAVESPGAAQRQALLDEQCGDDGDLRAQVESLLAASEHAGSFLEHSPVEGSPTVATDGDSRPTAPSGFTDRTQLHVDDVSLDFLTSCDTPGVLGRLGPYEITDVIGRGGMGIVLKARDTSLNRVVAIKVLAPELAGNATARKRFLREARAAAAIRDDHVVTIYAVHDGTYLKASALDPQPSALPHLVMEFIDGQSLQQKIDSAGPLELKETLRIGAQVAAGLAAAHAHGVIHRDIKPSNILLENGVERVRITDFGLARAVDDVEITRTGDVAGTPQYMSPEQAQGQPVDARSDLFSLGSVLYAMCTGRSPFRAESTIAAIRRVCDDTPRPIREVNAETPDRLTQIIDRLLAKRPEERFQTAQEVADLLGQHLAHVQHPAAVLHPVTLPSPPRGEGPGVRGRASSRWVAAILILLAVLAGLGVTEATGVTHLAGTVVRIVTGEGTLIIEIDDPTVQVSLDGEELTISGGGVEQVRLRPGQYQFTAARNGQPVKQELVTITRGGERIVTVSREAVERAAATDLPLSANELRRYPGHGGQVFGVAASRNGRLLSVNGDRYEDGQFIKAPDYTLLVRDITSGNILRRIAHEGEVNCVVVAHDGDRAATACAAGPVRLLDLVSGLELQRCGEAGGYAVALPQDARYVACLDNVVPGTDQSFRVWDVAQEKVFKVFPWSDGDIPVADGIEPVIWTLAFSPDGTRVAAGGAYYREGEPGPQYAIRIWDVPSGQELPGFSGHTGQVKSIVFSRDGRRLLSGSFDSTVRLWDVPSAQLLRIIGKHVGLVECVDLSADGRRALSAGWDDRNVRLWDVESGAELRRFPHPSETLCVAFAPEGETAFSGDKDGIVRSWRLPAPTPEPQAFVRLAQPDLPERKFDKLSEAVVDAGDGGTIEIRGNGPFVTDPITIARALTIRAGDGFRPVIRLSPNGIKVNFTLLTAEAPLVLEGMEFQELGPDARVNGSALVTCSSSLHLTNCRFATGASRCIDALGSSPVCHIRNCEFASLALEFPIAVYGHRLLLDNCVLVGKAVFNSLQCRNDAFAAPPHDGMIRLTRNSFADASFSFDFCLPPATNPISVVRVEASGNLFAGPSVFRVVHAPLMEEVLRPAGTTEDLLTRMLAWQGDRNVYSPRRPYLPMAGLQEPVPTIESLEQWKTFWGSTEAGSIEGVVRFQGGDLVAKVIRAPEDLVGDDFRLRADSAGYQAGPNGMDLGADIDLVGPGAAYERWKQTPEYQEWLKETGQK